MSAAKQAPGPLELHGEPGRFWISGPNGSIVLAAGASAKCGRAGDHYECGHVEATARLHLSEKYARLFVAAPELLDALMGVLAAQLVDETDYRSTAERQADANRAARAAIAKATSQQTNPTR